MKHPDILVFYYINPYYDAGMVVLSMCFSLMGEMAEIKVIYFAFEIRKSKYSALLRIYY